MKKTKTFTLTALSLVMALSLVACSNENKAKDEQKAFDNFMKQEFIDTLESSYLDLHIACENPKAYGIDADKVEVSFGSHMDEKTIEKQKQEMEETIDAFNEFDRDLLTEKQQDLYDTYAFKAELAQDLSDDDYEYYASEFSSMSGLQFQLASTLADWEIRNEKDIKDLITLIKDTLPYVDSVLEYTKKQQEEGYLMIDLDAVINYCQKIISKQENSSILASLYQEIDDLQLEETKSNAYKEELKNAFINSFIPAYQNIVETMEELKNTNTNKTGLSSFPNGKSYYKLLLKNSIGSDKSVKEIKKMMEEEYRDHLLKMVALAQSNPDLLNTLETLPVTTFKEYSEIVDFLKTRMSEDFPAIKDLTYNIQSINPDINSDTGIAAYFQVPAVDATTPKQLRVNPNIGDINSISTYSTVAHEGFPGHMYQFAYAYENLDSDYAKILNNILAYSEGFAVYSELFAYQYLDDIDPLLKELLIENQLATYCVIILADIGIHYEGWNYDEFLEAMQTYGLASSENQEGMKETYNQLVYNPCAFQPYYVGYHEFANLKEKAEEALKKDFDNKSFHKALLESGSAPFSVVERHVDAYIEKASK